MSKYEGFISQKLGQMRGNDSSQIDNCHSSFHNRDKPHNHGHQHKSLEKPKFGSRNQNSNKAKAQKVPDQVMKISIICAGQIFGNEDVLNDRNYTTTVKCLSNEAMVYCIKAEEFKNRMSRDDKTWRILKSLTISKDDTTIGKIKMNVIGSEKRKKTFERENILRTSHKDRNTFNYSG